MSNRIYEDTIILANLGVGKIPSLAKIHVQGTGNLLALQGTAVGDQEYLSFYNSAGSRRGYFGFGSVSNPNITISNDETSGNINLLPQQGAGSVGIGTAVQGSAPNNTLLGFINGSNIQARNALPQFALSSNIDGDWYNATYKANGYAAQIVIDPANMGGPGNGIAFSIAPSGVAGAAITWNRVMTIIANGFVGIGTNSPASKLSIVAVGSNTSVEFSTDSTQGSILAYDRVADGFKNLRYRGLDFIWTPSDVEKMRLLNNGNLGIGTNGPGVRLVVIGGNNATGPTLGSGTVGASALLSSNSLYGLYQGVSNTGDVWNQVQRNDSNGAVYNYLINPLGGNVGIGTSSPTQAKLQIQGAGAILSLQGVTSAGEAQYMTWYDGAGTRRAYVGFGSGSNDYFYINNDEANAHIILSTVGTGFVGIGTTPTQKLTVAGNILGNVLYGAAPTKDQISVGSSVGTAPFQAGTNGGLIFDNDGFYPLVQGTSTIAQGYVNTTQFGYVRDNVNNGYAAIKMTGDGNLNTPKIWKFNNDGNLISTYFTSLALAGTNVRPVSINANGTLIVAPYRTVEGTYGGVPVELYNDTGIGVTYTNPSTGLYRLTFSSAFYSSSSKVVTQVSTGVYTGTMLIGMIGVLSTTVIEISVRNSSGVLSSVTSPGGFTVRIYN